MNLLTFLLNCLHPLAFACIDINLSALLLKMLALKIAFEFACMLMNLLAQTFNLPGKYYMFPFLDTYNVIDLQR